MKEMMWKQIHALVSSMSNAVFFPCKPCLFSIMEIDTILMKLGFRLLFIILNYLQ